MNLVVTQLKKNQSSLSLKFGKRVRVLVISTIHTKWDNQRTNNGYIMGS